MPTASWLQPPARRVNAQIASALLLLLAAPMGSALSAEPGFEWQIREETSTAELRFGGQPVATYMFAYDNSTPERLADTFKPYLHVYAPDAPVLLTKGGGGLYPHHHGVYLGYNKSKYAGADGVSAGESDFWHCTNGDHQRHAQFVKTLVDGNKAVLSTVVHWNSGQGKVVIKEHRTFDVEVRTLGADRRYWQIYCNSKLETGECGEVELTGDRQHAGIQYRAPQSVAESNSARFVRPTGFPESAEAVDVSDAVNPQDLVGLKWDAMHFPVDGREYTLLYFDKAPTARYAERNYGRVGAFTTVTAKPEEIPEVACHLLIIPGEPLDRATIQGLYDGLYPAEQAAGSTP